VFIFQPTYYVESISNTWNSYLVYHFNTIFKSKLIICITAIQKIIIPLNIEKLCHLTSWLKKNFLSIKLMRKLQIGINLKAFMFYITLRKRWYQWQNRKHVYNKDIINIIILKDLLNINEQDIQQSMWIWKFAYKRHLFNNWLNVSN
jgi:hypothetical protein